jgi:hypothetical protein
LRTRRMSSSEVWTPKFPTIKMFADILNVPSLSSFQIS